MDQEFIFGFNMDELPKWQQDFIISNMHKRLVPKEEIKDYCKCLDTEKHMGLEARIVFMDDLAGGQI